MHNAKEFISLEVGFFWCWRRNLLRLWLLASGKRDHRKQLGDGTSTLSSPPPLRFLLFFKNFFSLFWGFPYIRLVFYPCATAGRVLSVLALSVWFFYLSLQSRWHHRLVGLPGLRLVTCRFIVFTVIVGWDIVWTLTFAVILTQHFRTFILANALMVKIFKPFLRTLPGKNCSISQDFCSPTTNHSFFLLVSLHHRN